MCLQQSDVRDTDESPALTGPELNHWFSLWNLVYGIDIREAHAAQVRGHTDENVPEIKTQDFNFKSFFKHMTNNKMFRFEKETKLIIVTS